MIIKALSKEREMRIFESAECSMVRKLNKYCNCEMRRRCGWHYIGIETGVKYLRGDCSAVENSPNSL